MTQDELNQITDPLHAILTELGAIRAALEKPKAATATAKTTASTGPQLTALPPPDMIVLNAGDVAVHFGKNNGTPISSLNDKQLLWYGADREPQLKNDGTPFPPREADTLLKNACRTLWQERHGVATTQATATKPARAPSDSEEVPF